ncbi:MAG: alpha/beta hydrolase, partial [Planctomycetota bacterium]
MLRRFGWKGLALVWLALLLASNLWRATLPAPAAPAGARPVTVTAQGPGGALPGTLRVDLFEAGPADAPRLLLLHGSPGSHADFREMLPELASAFHVLAPDLPGFGEGAQKAADYGFLADARVLAEVLEREGGAPWHVVGFSMGSAVALELSALAPERVASVTMLAGLGVEELELLGDSQLNHSLHALLLGLTRAVDLLVPHFGAFDRFPINVAHARNFYDSKQARLRPLLEQLRVPVLILHGDRDVLVSPFAAREHARIVPQAELVWFEGANHFLPWTHPAE